MNGRKSQDDVDDAGNPGEMAPQVVHVCTLPGWQEASLRYWFPLHSEETFLGAPGSQFWEDTCKLCPCA
jgi:hypothetical protein